MSGSAPVEIEVHDRLAPRRLARVQDGLDRPVGVPLDADDRVQHALDAEPALAQRRAHRVDQERPVLGVGLHHRALPLVAVGLERRRERAHRDRLRAAGGGELEGADDLAAAAPPAAARRRSRRPRAGAGTPSRRRGRPGRALLQCARRSGRARTPRLSSHPLFRRSSSASSWAATSPGRRSPNSAKNSRIDGISGFHCSTSTREDPLELLVGDVEAVGVQRLDRRHAADRRVTRLGGVVTAAEHPLEHARILSETGPQEAARLEVLAEPVDVEDLRQLRAFALRPSSASGPSSRPCGSRRTAASRTGRGAACRPRRPPRRSSPRTCWAPRKTPCSQSNASWISGTTVERRPPNSIASIGTPVGSSQSGAIAGSCAAGVVKRAFGWAAGRSLCGVQSLPLPVDRVRRGLLRHPFPPDVAVVGQRAVGEDRVLATVAIAFGLVLLARARRDAEEAGLRD